MRLFNKLKTKMNMKLMSVIFIGMIALAGILTVTSSTLISSVFEQLYTEKLMTAAHVLLAQYASEDLLPFITRLEKADGFGEAAVSYAEDRAFILKTDETGGTDLPDEYYAARERMAEHRRAAAALKDEDYYSLYRRLLEVKVGTGVKYLYIIADLGIDGVYVYLFDAIFQGDTVYAENDDYGTADFKTNFPLIGRVFETGEPVLEYGGYGNMHSGALCYSYTPVLDGRGNVVAVIGADINLQSLNSRLNNFLTISIILIIWITAIITVVIIYMLGVIVIKPIRKLTGISSEIAAGNFYAAIPKRIIGRSDEMGTLGRSYESMNNALQDMYSMNSMLLEAAISGKLDTRIDSAPFKGFYARLVEKTNDTLDIIGVYFDSIPGSFAVLDSGYDIVYTNQHFKRTFSGFTTDHLYRKILGGPEGDDDLDSLKKRFADTLRDGEHTALAPFGIGEEVRWFSFVCNRVTNNNGAVVVIWDNTELVSAKDRALSANKAKSEFLSRVSHELRTPLNVIMSMAKLGNNDTDIAESKRRFGRIVSSSSHLAQIINDVLEMSRMESGKTELRYAPINLREILGTCMDMLELRAAEKGLELTSEIGEPVPDSLIGDEFRIRQILINLISNALKFTEKGRVSVHISMSGESDGGVLIKFVVADTGVGMSDDFMERAFTPFEQEDRYLSRRYEGTGLGLSISHDLVVLMGGEMRAESRLGEGSSFIFTIPFERSPDKKDGRGAEREAPEADDSILAGKRILLVDDIEINRVIVCEILSGTGIDIDEAVDGRAALDIFSRSAPGYYDCILMDIQMPVMDGYESTIAIRNSGREDGGVAIIAMTANALKEDVDYALGCGMNDHIAKPLDFDECVRTIKKYLK